MLTIGRTFQLPDNINFLYWESQACSFSSSHCFHMFNGCAEAKLWHVSVEHFEFIWFDQISLVPDSYNFVCTNSLIELLPRFEMWFGGVARESFKFFK